MGKTNLSSYNLTSENNILLFIQASNELPSVPRIKHGNYVVVEGNKSQATLSCNEGYKAVRKTDHGNTYAENDINITLKVIPNQSDNGYSLSWDETFNCLRIIYYKPLEQKFQRILLK